MYSLTCLLVLLLLITDFSSTLNPGPSGQLLDNKDDEVVRALAQLLVHSHHHRHSHHQARQESGAVPNERILGVLGPSLGARSRAAFRGAHSEGIVCRAHCVGPLGVPAVGRKLWEELLEAGAEKFALPRLTPLCGHPLHFSMWAPDEGPWAWSTSHDGCTSPGFEDLAAPSLHDVRVRLFTVVLCLTPPSASLLPLHRKAKGPGPGATVAQQPPQRLHLLGYRRPPTDMSTQHTHSSTYLAPACC